MQREAKRLRVAPAEEYDCIEWSGRDDFSDFATFANLRVLAWPMSVHDGEDQKDLSRPNMH